MDHEIIKNLARGAKLAAVIWVVWALLSISVVVGVVYIAIHFLAKVW